MFRVERNPVGGFWPSVVMFDEVLVFTGHTKQCNELALKLNATFVVAEAPADTSVRDEIMALYAEVNERSAFERNTSHGSRGRTRQSIYRRVALLLEPIVTKLCEPTR